MLSPDRLAFSCHIFVNLDVSVGTTLVLNTVKTKSLKNRLRRGTFAKRLLLRVFNANTW